MNAEKAFDLVLTGGMVVLENGCVPAAIGIIDGRIASIMDHAIPYQARKTIDISGKTVFPGLIDPHVHIWEPGPFTYREDFLHGTQAAAAGGVTTMIEMPLSVPPVIDQDSFDQKLNIANQTSVMDFALWGGLIPSSVDNLKQLHELGVTGFKAFMSYANEDFPHTPDYDLWKAMTIVAEFDGLVGVHAENAEIVYRKGRELELAGVNEGEAHSDGRPEIAEIEAIQRAILFAEKTGCRLYIVHMTVAEGIELVKQAKARGVRVSSETCHQYLLFDKHDLNKQGSFIKCNPPFRTKENREKLWEQVMEGHIDCIGSDHGPYTDSEKSKDTIWEAPSGFGGIELIFPTMISEGFHKRGMSLESIAQITSTNAAKIHGLYPKKGTIRIGSDADLVIADLNKEWTYDGEKSLSKTKSRRSPYHGLSFRGDVSMTIVRGSVVYHQGSIEVEPGYGQFVPLQKQ